MFLKKDITLVHYINDMLIELEEQDTTTILIHFEDICVLEDEK